MPAGPMTHPPRSVPHTVEQAAGKAWRQWSARIAAVRPVETGPQPKGPRRGAPGSGQSPQQQMIAKIRRRMREYPDWYEADPGRVAQLVVRELERIGAVLELEIPRTDQPIEVWRVPLSVFNWLVDTPHGEGFVRGALKAWSSAQCFNAANGRSVEADQAARLRAPFLDISPPLLRAVLDQLLREDLWVGFAQIYVGAELKFLGLRVQRPG